MAKVYGKDSQPKPAKLNKLTEIEHDILESANVVNQQLQNYEEEFKNKMWREQAVTFKTKIQKFQAKENLGKLMT